VVVVVVHDGEAATIDGDAGGDGEVVGESRGVDSEFAAGRAAFQARDGAEVFDDAGEHGDCSTIANSGVESKTYKVQSATARGGKHRQPYYNLVRFAFHGQEKGKSRKKKDSPLETKCGHPALR